MSDEIERAQGSSDVPAETPAGGASAEGRIRARGARLSPAR